jgi:probable HAF family extracellular repeat protein
LGGNYSYPKGINSAGDVVGISTVAGDASYHSFLWTATGGLQDIGTLGGDSAYAVAINSSDQIIGTSTTADGYSHNFLWSPSTGMVAFGNGELVGINSSGEVAGIAIGEDGNLHSFLWSAATGKMDLGLAKGEKSAEATALNDLGQVVGVAGTSEGFVWTKAKGNQPIAGTSYFRAIDNQGAATGYVAIFSQFYGHAVLWSQSAGVIDIGTLTNTNTDISDGFGISDNGQVVGYSTKNGVGGYAFVYSKAHGMQELDTLINSSWYITTAWGINSAGEIIATGIISGSNYPHTLLLTPQ